MNNNEIFPFKICRIFDKRFHGMEFYIENKTSSNVDGIVLQKIRIIDDISFITSEGMIHFTDEISDEMYSELKRLTSQDIIFNKDYYTIGDRYINIPGKKCIKILDSYSPKELKFKKYHGAADTYSFHIDEVYNKYTCNNRNAFYNEYEEFSVYVKLGNPCNDEFITKTPIISSEKVDEIFDLNKDILNRALVVNKSNKISYMIYRISADHQNIILKPTYYDKDHSISIDEFIKDYEMYKFKYGPKRGLTTEKYDISKLMKYESFKFDKDVDFFILRLNPSSKFVGYHDDFLHSYVHCSEYIIISDKYDESKKYHVYPSDVMEIYPIYKQYDWMDEVINFFRLKNERNI